MLVLVGCRKPVGAAGQHGGVGADRDEVEAERAHVPRRQSSRRQRRAERGRHALDVADAQVRRGRDGEIQAVRIQHDTLSERRVAKPAGETPRVANQRGRALAARALEPAADPLPVAGSLAATTIDVDALATRARRDYARLRSALDDARVPIGGASPADLGTELASHVWVQVEQDGGWVDLDASMPDAEPGRALTEALSVGDAMPPEAFQAITLRVSVEHLADVGLPDRLDVLERRLSAPDAAAAEVFLYFVPDSGGGGLLAKLTAKPASPNGSGRPSGKRPKQRR